MKKLWVLLLLTTGLVANAQLGNVINKAKKKAEDQINKKTEPEKKDDTGSHQESPEQPAAQNASSEKQGSIKTYSKYDFVPGERILWYEDFADDAIGDFPGKWNTDGSGETVTVDGKAGRWFMLTRKGFFMPDAVDSLPENFTVEYDLLVDKPVHSWGIFTALAELEDRARPENWQSSKNSFALNILPGNDGRGTCSYDRRKDGTGEASMVTPISNFTDLTNPVHVAIWRQNERLRIYLDEEKIWDIPKAIIPGAKLNSLIFWIQLTDGNWHFLLNNLRLAVGAPDTRNKLLTQNKWVTHGILFSVNSATIKPESYGTLKEMANVLKENGDLKVRIVGHTDADGDDASNLELSRRRALSVKTALVQEFGINENRMETDGKGEGEPVDKNTTAEGKANNRRVEFIKI